MRNRGEGKPDADPGPQSHECRTIARIPSVVADAIAHGRRADRRAAGASAARSPSEADRKRSYIVLAGGVVAPAASRWCYGCWRRDHWCGCSVDRLLRNGGRRAAIKRAPSQPPAEGEAAFVAAEWQEA